jgi:type IV pilus assembly protein PilZ
MGAPPKSKPVPASDEKRAADEKRAGDRAQITLKVDYKRINSFFADYTRNISKGGTFIRTTRPLAVGTEFLFVLTLPTPSTEKSSEALSLNGEVMWVVTEAEADAERPAGMGIKFKFANDGEREKVEAFVENLMKVALGEHISKKLLAKPAL